MATKYISDRTRQIVRSFTEQSMVATITVVRGTLGVMDPTTLLIGGMTSKTTIYSGPGRVRTVVGAGVIQVGDAPIDTRSTLISIPMSATPVPRRDDLVVVGQYDVSDTDLDGRAFRVMEVEGGGIFGDARRMTCVSWYQSREWNG